MTDNKIKLLIIEDDPFLLSMYSTKFEMEDFAVISAEDGEKGLIAAESEIPDLILLDILLPKMDGFDVLRELKKKDITRKIPVILLTNLSQKQDIEQGIALGADDYLVKAHFMPSEVVDKIRKILNKALV
jgi:DNA-binding response OmpR family regulator